MKSKKEIKNTINELIDKGFTDYEIFEELLKISFEGGEEI